MRLSRKWAVKVFIGFMAVMVVCTVLSRAAASALVAQVEVKGPGRGRLSYIYEGTGNVVPKKEEKIFLWEGQQVEWTAAKGSTVKKGKCLVRFRKKYLNQTIEKKQEEITQLELQVKEQQISARTPERVRASESAYRTLAEAEKKLNKAKAREEKAKAAWEACREKEETASQEELDDGGTKEQELKETYLAAKSEAEAASQEKSQAQAAYDLAKKEDAAQDKNSADAHEAALTGVQATIEQAETAKKELNILKGYKKAGGKILAEQDCTVLESNVQIGGITAGTEYISLGNGGWKLEGEIRSEDAKKIMTGAAVSVQFATGGETEAEIESVEMTGAQDNSDSGAKEQTSCFWYAKLSEEAEDTDDVQPGTFTWKTEVESEEEYEQVIPLSALREDITGAYCLVITETEQMLGALQTAKRVPVTVLEKDGTNAAVTSELEKGDQIIVASEKFVAGGDRVRIKE